MELWKIGAELDDVNTRFCQVRNMLYVFDECMEHELKFMKQRNDGYAEYFLERYDMIRSVMEVMQLHINDAIDAMQVQIDAVYEADRKDQLRATE